MTFDEFLTWFKRSSEAAAGSVAQQLDEAKPGLLQVSAAAVRTHRILQHTCASEAPFYLPTKCGCGLDRAVWAAGC